MDIIYRIHLSGVRFVPIRCFQEENALHVVIPEQRSRHSIYSEDIPSSKTVNDRE